MQDWLDGVQWLNHPATTWLYAAAGALLGFLLVRTALAVVGARLRRLGPRLPGTAMRTVHALQVVVASTRTWLLFLLAFAIAARVLDFGTRADHWIERLTLALVGLQVALWANALVEHWLGRAGEPASEARGNPVMLGILRWGAQFVVWTTLLMALLANIGVDITAFVASLGIGGVAVALALQSVLGDLFSSISIGLDKPFEVGEFIAFGSDLGTVRHVGIKTTRIDSLRGEQLVISNSRLLDQLVHNYSRMPQRRVVFGFRVPYGTHRAKVQAIVDGVRAHIEQEPKARYDRGHLAAFGEYGLEFEFVYYVLASDYTLYCDIQQSVNLRIMDLLEELEVRFAVPVRTVHVTETVRISEDARADEDARARDARAQASRSGPRWGSAGA